MCEIVVKIIFLLENQMMISVQKCPTFVGSLLLNIPLFNQRLSCEYMNFPRCTVIWMKYIRCHVTCCFFFS